MILIKWPECKSTTFINIYKVMIREMLKYNTFIYEFRCLKYINTKKVMRGKNDMYSLVISKSLQYLIL